MLTELPTEQQALADAFRAAIEDAIGPKFAGMIVYGAVCFPPSPVTDFDFHVWVTGEFTTDEHERLVAVHEQMKDVPGGDDMDGYFVTLDAARKVEDPRTEMWPEIRDFAWSLHRAHWHAGRFVLVAGDDPRGFVPVPSWPELDHGLVAELRFISDATAIRTSTAFCVLNLCRVLSSYEDGNVVRSKLDGALWALGALPTDWHDLIRWALDAYRTRGFAPDDERRAQAESFFEDAMARIAKVRVPV